MPLWQVLLLGVVQGLTEFLPISSTAHLLVVQRALGRSEEELKGDPFTVVIQLGTLVAVFLYFRRDIVALVKGLLRDIAERRLFTSATPEGRLVKLIVIGTIPVVVAGLTLKKLLREHFYGLVPIAIVSISFALLMALAEWIMARRVRSGATLRGDDSLRYSDSILVGMFQALALMPGGSRSGTTITAGLFAGLSRPAAARFSFLLSLPSVLAAGVKELYDWLKIVKTSPELQEAAKDQAVALAIGTLVSFVVGYISIAWLMHFLRRYSTLAFVIYRIFFGLLILGLVAAGMIR